MNISGILYAGDFVMCDPGPGETLRASSRSLVQFPLTTTDDETRTIPAPERAGLFVAVNLMAGGGDLTLHVVGGFDQAGSRMILFDDVGASVMLYSIQTSKKNFQWRVLAADGVTFP